MRSPNRFDRWRTDSAGELLFPVDDGIASGSLMTPLSIDIRGPPTQTQLGSMPMTTSATERGLTGVGRFGMVIKSITGSGFWHSRRSPLNNADQRAVGAPGGLHDQGHDTIPTDVRPCRLRQILVVQPAQHHEFA